MLLVASRLAASPTLIRRHLPQVPIAVRDPQMGSSWRLVSWIDSKATFGDDRIHTRQYEEQYTTYVNRYGPGLVIYWFGCVEGLSCLDPNVAVLEGFPEPEDVDVLPQRA